ncbi:MAG: rhomboid family intramembrane serine protease [Deltaproteobacteria bacterium]|nr:rhomboid family intramembrane serine protease [Deltaproteobacteria bacterium]
MPTDPLGGLGPPPEPEGPGPQLQRPQKFIAPPTPSTRALLLLLALFFVAQSWLGDWDTANPVALYRLGALYWPAVLDGDVWRLGAYAFLHIGPLHFLMNAWTLWILMRPLEATQGPVTPVGLFAATALMGGLCSAVSGMLLGHQYTIAAGASAGIFGLFGAQAAIFVRLRKRLPPQLRKAAINALLINIALNIVVAFSFPVDNAAHLGGLVSGFLLGLWVPMRGMPERLQNKVAQWFVIGCAFLLFALEGAAVARAARPRARVLRGADYALTLDWTLVPLGHDHAVSPGDLGLELYVDRVAHVPQGELATLGDHAFVRERSHGNRPDGAEVVRTQLTTPWHDGALRLTLECSDPSCEKSYDSALDDLAATLRAR